MDESKSEIILEDNEDEIFVDDSVDHEEIEVPLDMIQISHILLNAKLDATKHMRHLISKFCSKK